MHYVQLLAAAAISVVFVTAVATALMAKAMMTTIKVWYARPFSMIDSLKQV